MADTVKMNRFLPITDMGIPFATGKIVRRNGENVETEEEVTIKIDHFLDTKMIRRDIGLRLVAATNPDIGSFHILATHVMGFVYKPRKVEIGTTVRVPVSVHPEGKGGRLFFIENYGYLQPDRNGDPYQVILSQLWRRKDLIPEDQLDTEDETGECENFDVKMCVPLFEWIKKKLESGGELMNLLMGAIQTAAQSKKKEKPMEVASMMEE